MAWALLLYLLCLFIKCSLLCLVTGILIVGLVGVSVVFDMCYYDIMVLFGTSVLWMWGVVRTGLLGVMAGVCAILWWVHGFLVMIGN